MESEAEQSQGPDQCGRNVGSGDSEHVTALENLPQQVPGV